MMFSHTALHLRARRLCLYNVMLFALHLGTTVDAELAGEKT